MQARPARRSVSPVSGLSHSARSSGRRRRNPQTVTRTGWIAVLVITAVFHAIRGAPVDAWIYAAGAAVLTLDALGWLRVPLRMPADRDTVSRRVIAGTLIAVAALTLGFTPLYSPADTAIVVGLGVLLLPVAWADRTRADAGPPGAAVRRAAVLWSIVIVVFCLWEIGVFFLGRDLTGSKEAFPALSDLLDPVLAWPPARVVLVACWLLGGYALLRRGRST